MFLFFTAQGHLHSAQGKASWRSLTFLQGLLANLFPIIIIVCQQGVCIVLDYLMDITAMVHFNEFCQLWSYKKLNSCYTKITTKRFLFLNLTLTWPSHWHPRPVTPRKRTSYIIAPLRAGCEAAYESARGWLFPPLLLQIPSALFQNCSLKIWVGGSLCPLPQHYRLTVCSLLDGSCCCHWDGLGSTKCLVLMLHQVQILAKMRHGHINER